ncbi:glycoside hydrolase family 65 protein [Acidiferrimicrobium sp. IK]|uniref:glycoside hydrolase family 65 protein n=1 Tax=Acidiferrimicrobium sp. IK TaxID=2871700 RepID=UPI0021CB9016|nr:glycosyl hydrolase family 65 protein [Acidiferrimicrobium sp. IK]MCU4184331.1 glycoside hydrolase family 65 protein [Acidiferrimicrobium sp. IK]
MNGHTALTLEDWGLREDGLDVARLAQTESLFAACNGHIGVRGNLDEGEPHALPGTYLNSFYEVRPLPYAEGGYGYPEAGQTVVNVIDAKPIRLLVDDEPFDLRYGHTASHQRRLDIRAGTLGRSTEWTSPGRRSVRVRSTRLVSLVQRAMLAIEWEVEVLDAAARVVVQSELVANEEIPSTTHDPRVAAVLRNPLRVLENEHTNATLFMLAETATSALRVATMAHHLWEGPEGTEFRSDSFGETARASWITTLEPGQTLKVVKLVAYGWSRRRSIPALRDQVSAALLAAEHTGWEGMLAEQAAFLEDYWDLAAVDIEGDDHLQRAVRFSMFHVLQSGARSEGRGIPAKGLTGPGYDGHKFWDTETFVLPVLTYTMPEAAGDALMWRHRILPAARERAAQLGLRGAAFPWRTIGGAECSAYWPAGTAAFHIAADIADAATRYVAASGDVDWERKYAVDILVETARLWVSLGYFAPGDGFRIDGVTGPDEYSAVADNNVFTNLMARRNLLAAADVVARHPGVRPDVLPDEVTTWRRAAEEMAVPFDARLGVHPQAEGFTDHAAFDFASMTADDYPLLLHVPYFDLYRKRVVKQADLVLALHLCGDQFSDEEKAADFAYYEPLTVRDSSLSATTQGIVAAETGYLDLAYRYTREAALMDVDDLERNTRDGLHMASLAGAWLVPVAGFGGMRDHGGRLSFKPRLPAPLRSLGFSLLWRGRRLRVEVNHHSATYSLHAVERRSSLDGVRPGGTDPIDSLSLLHYGEEVTVGVGEHHRLPIPDIVERSGVSQPEGRGPMERLP